MTSLLSAADQEELDSFKDALTERNTRLDLIERIAHGYAAGCRWIPMTRHEVGLAIDAVAACVQHRDSEWAPLLHRLQDAYKDSKNVAAGTVERHRAQAGEVIETVGEPAALCNESPHFTADELEFAAIACDLYADEFPETICEDDPETASEVLQSASAKLMALRGEVEK